MKLELAIVDFNRTIYDPETGEAMSGAKALLEMLRAKGIRCVLLSNKEEGRSDTLEKIGLASYFEEAVFVDDKTPEIISDILQRYGVSAVRACVVGDHLHKEIRAGRGAGVYTVLLKAGKYAALPKQTEHDAPHVTVSTLDQARAILARL